MNEILKRMGGSKIKTQLLYKGSRDGWNYNDFHSRCDNKGPSVTLFYTSEGRKCGGFTSQSWDSKTLRKFDSKSFIFSLDNKSVFPINNPEIAIYCGSNIGPAFGSNTWELSAHNEPFN